MLQDRRCLHDGMGHQRHKDGISSEVNALPKLRMHIAFLFSSFVLMKLWLDSFWSYSKDQGLFGGCQDVFRGPAPNA